ncbi:MAG: hypothetical protein KDE56_27915 [Anaerolineales bacterium]|nr:hypothetical protein [Anaerolineales bacterium]
MNEHPPAPKTPRNAASWAKPVETFTVGNMPAEAINLNVDGKRVAGPLHGFGQLWQKTYRVQLTGKPVKPADVVAVWKAKFPEFWPQGNRFYGPATGVAPGEVAVLNLAMPGGMKVSTGIRVIYADDESFAFITPEGHMFGGMITFSAEEAGESSTVQIQALIRASDPIYEIGCRLGFAHKLEDEFWHGTLKNLAAHVGTPNATVSQKNVCVDKRVQWSEAKNVWHNAAIRTAVYLPVHLIKQLFKKG